MYLRPDKQYAASFMSDIDIHIKELEFLKNIILKHGTRTEIKKKLKKKKTQICVQKSWQRQLKKRLRRSFV